MVLALNETNSGGGGDDVFGSVESVKDFADFLLGLIGLLVEGFEALGKLNQERTASDTGDLIAEGMHLGGKLLEGSLYSLQFVVGALAVL